MKTFRDEKRTQEIRNVNYQLCFGLGKNNIQGKVHQGKG